MGVSVCLCVCPSVSISPEIHVRSSPVFGVCQLSMAVARSFSGGAVTRYVAYRYSGVGMASCLRVLQAW